MIPRQVLRRLKEIETLTGARDKEEIVIQVCFVKPSGAVAGTLIPRDDGAREYVPGDPEGEQPAT